MTIPGSSARYALAAFLIVAIATSALSQGPETTRSASIVFTTLAAGDRFTCGISSGAAAYCWGADYYGQLGVGSVVDQCDRSIYAKGPCARAPVAVVGGHRFTAIAAGVFHACAIDDAGAAYCWGQNHFGQLGSANASDHCTRESSRAGEEMALACSRIPLLVPLPSAVVSITAGEYMSCAVDQSGRAWCWGSNGRSNTAQHVPLDAQVTSISAGGSYVCALTVNGGIRCWSWPEVISKPAVAPIEELGWTTITAGTKHACALDSAGAAACWGSDADGALGIGHNRHQKYDDVPVTTVLGNRRFGALWTGVKQTCGIDAGALYCWGRVDEKSADDRCLDSNGVANTNACTTRPVLVHPRTRFRTVAIGSSHACAVATSGTAYCWGANEAGQLGDGTLRATTTLAEVRTLGVSRSETGWLDTRERLGVLLPRGGFALLVLLLMAVTARRWMSELTLLDLVALGVGSLVLGAVLSKVGSQVAASGHGDLLSIVAWQPAMIVAGVALFRLGVYARGWWRAGGGRAEVATTPSVPGVRPAPRILTTGPDNWRPLIAVVVGWVLVAWTFIGISTSNERGDVAYGLAMLAILVTSGAALILSAISAAVSIVRLRRDRGANKARFALVLASLTLIAGTIAALAMFWPRER